MPEVGLDIDTPFYPEPRPRVPVPRLATHCPTCDRTYEEAAKDPKCDSEWAAKKWAEEHPEEMRRQRELLHRWPTIDFVQLFRERLDQWEKHFGVPSERLADAFRDENGAVVENVNYHRWSSLYHEWRLALLKREGDRG